jgi:hypothetical protein
MALSQQQPVIAGVFHQAITEGQLGVLPPRVGQVLLDEFAESETVVQVPHQAQATIGSDSASREADLQGSTERELKGLVLVLNHRVGTYNASSPRLGPHIHR